jgi:anti-sigma factor RsiW
MNSPAERHLNPGTLRQFADGELPAAEQSRAERHFAECPECRNLRDEATEGWMVYLDYRSTIVLQGTSLPANWSDLQAGMEEVDARIRARRKSRAARNTWWRWATAGLAAAALVAAYYGYRQTPSVQAAGLLRKAVAAARPPLPGARIRLHTRRRDVVRPAAVPPGGRDELASLFANAGYDWNLPFSAQAFEEWRDRLPDKHDAVHLLAHDGGSGPPVYLIRTSSAANALASATLVLRASDYLPVRETLEFRAHDSVEITSEPGEPAEIRTPALAPAAATAERIAAVPLAVRQLRALAALHAIHADLGEVELSAAGQILTIQGGGIGDARREQIQRAVGSMDGIELSLDSGAEAPAPGTRTTDAAGPAPEAPLRGLLASHLGAGAPVDEAINQILDASDAMLAQAFAWNSLAGWFSPKAEAALADADRASLLRLRDDYSREFLAQFERLAQLLSPLATVGQTAARDSGTWQYQAAAVLANAKSLDAVLSAGFASASAAGPPGQMMGRLEDALRNAKATAGGAR